MSFISISCSKQGYLKLGQISEGSMINHTYVLGFYVFTRSKLPV